MKFNRLIVGGLASLFLMLFSYFSTHALFFALVFLIMAQFAIIISCKDIPVSEISGFFRFQFSGYQYLLSGIVIIGSILFAVFYRQMIGLSPFPTFFTGFMVTGILIGITEEFIYRGYFVWVFEPLGKAAIPFICSAAHTLYKVALFLPYPGTDLIFLGTWTFAIGVFLGYIRVFGKSIIPCILFHGIFDAVVYGDRVSPWWVW